MVGFFKGFNCISNQTGYRHAAGILQLQWDNGLSHTCVQYSIHYRSRDRLTFIRGDMGKCPMAREHWAASWRGRLSMGLETQILNSGGFIPPRTFGPDVSSI